MAFDFDDAAASSRPTSGHALGRAAAVLALGGLLALCWSHVSRVHRHRHTGRPVAAPHRVQTWEGEGGRPLPDDDGEGDDAALPPGSLPDSPSPAVPVRAR